MANKEVDNKNKFIETYLGSDDFNINSEKFGLFSKDKLPIYSWKRLETRTRKENPDTALSFAVHDPLWMLTRQWQFGEFKGNDCGSAIWAKIKIEHEEITSVSNNKSVVDFDRKNALEYQVERMNVQITDAVRVDSAYYLKKSIDFSPLKSKSKDIFKDWQKQFPLETFSDTSVNLENSEKTPKEHIAEIKRRKNTRLETYLAAFSNRAFDGYKAYDEEYKDYMEYETYEEYKKHKTIPDSVIFEKLSEKEQSIFFTICKSFAIWFKETYLPAEGTDNFWVDEKLGYELSVSVNGTNEDSLPKDYSVEDYHSGRLSWYSFDLESQSKNLNDELKEKKNEASKQITGKDNEKLFSFIPVLAEFPGSPHKRLWAFEDMKVAMGNSELSAESLANAVILQYTTMYGNDWLLTPMELNAGMVSKVKGIIVTDVFGNRYFINRQAGDTTSPETRYSGKWEMFTISKKNAYEDKDFTTDGSLFFPPSLARTEESEPIEEVQFLRDEMANLIWAVELKINDGCGKALDGDSYAAEVNTELEVLTPKHGDAEETEADYSYLFQNSVPLNWIPFSPVKFKPGEPNAIREIRLQRSTIPMFIKDRFEPIRPCTSLMRTGIDDNDKVKEHKFINEEEILAVGTKVILTNQRTRWFNGKSYNWLGAKKEISRTQANSGLSFDELVEIVSKSASEVDLREEK